MTDYSTADIIARAREKIENHGWTQGYFEAPDGSMCVTMAMTRARTELPGREPLCAKGQDFILKATSESSAQNLVDWSSIPEWNDHPETTYEDVQLVLKRAEIAARDEELRGK